MIVRTSFHILFVFSTLLFGFRVVLSWPFVTVAAVLGGFVVTYYSYSIQVLSKNSKFLDMFEKLHLHLNVLEFDLENH